MEFVIITGSSGAGKTNVLHMMEDIGFYCVDNIPPALLSTLYDLCNTTSDKRMKRVAVVIDVRGGNVFDTLVKELSKFRKEGKNVKILFLDSKNDTLLIRYKETRRKHPLTDLYSNITIKDAVELEKQLLKPIKANADYIIDTTNMSLKLLRERVATLFLENVKDGLIVTCMSYGFKYGIPLEADLLLDVRCLPNPFYIDELKKQTGLDEPVRSYVMGFEESVEMANRYLEFLKYTLPLYRKEGKSELVIGVGCTGGKHRSVTIACYLNTKLTEAGYRSGIHHRDIWKP